MDLLLLRLLLELGFCFVAVASVPPINDQSSADFLAASAASRLLRHRNSNHHALFSLEKPCIQRGQ